MLRKTPNMMYFLILKSKINLKEAKFLQLLREYLKSKSFILLYIELFKCKCTYA